MPSRGSSLSKGPVAGGSLLSGWREQGTAESASYSEELGRARSHRPRGMLGSLLFIPRVSGNV